MGYPKISLITSGKYRFLAANEESVIYLQLQNLQHFILTHFHMLRIYHSAACISNKSHNRCIINIGNFAGTANV